MIKHTKGPWRIWGANTELNLETAIDAPLITAWDEDAEESIDVATIHNDLPEFAGNAHLISAAPELLEASKALLRELDNTPGSFGSVRYEDNLRKAVRKAEEGC